MAITIDIESRKRARQPYNLDNLTYKYKTANGLFIFPSPSLWVLEKNLFYLLKNSVVKEFKKEWTMRPSYMSYDEYGTVALENILMYVNGVQCIENFDLDSVIVPTFQAIVNICKDKISQKLIENFEVVNW